MTIRPGIRLVAVALCSMLGPLVRAEAPASQPGASQPLAVQSAVSQPAGDGGKVVGTVLGQPIHERDLRPPRTATGPAAEGMQERYAAQTLARKITKPLLDQFVKENRLAPTPEELATATEGIRRQMARTLEKNRRDLVEVTQRLAAPGLTDEDRKQLETRKHVLERSIAFSEEAQSKQGRRDMAEVLAEWQLPSWKLNKALYRKYGGTVIWQQAGTEAVGAMRVFLEEHEKAGHFRIDDPKLNEEFWKYYRRTDHPFQVKKADPFDRPPWEEEQQERRPSLPARPAK